MNFTINIKLLINLTIVFILFTAIGTLSHEYGHIAVAKIVGYDTELHYASMNYYPKGYLEDNDSKALKALKRDYVNIDYEYWPKEIKEKKLKYDNILQKRYWNGQSNKSLFVKIGGPLQTILTGSIGIIILIIRRKKIKLNGLRILDWLAIFLSLFWLREIFNIVVSISREIIIPDGEWFSGDELFISQNLNLWSGTISILLGAIGLLASVFVVFKIVPKNLRFTFILSGLIGGISGFTLWMNIIGPKILP